MQKRVFVPRLFEDFFRGKLVVILDDEDIYHQNIAPFFRNLGLTIFDYFDLDTFMSEVVVFPPKSTIIISDVSLDCEFDISKPLTSRGGFWALNELINERKLNFPAVLRTNFVVESLESEARACGALGIFDKLSEGGDALFIDRVLALAMMHWLQTQ